MTIQLPLATVEHLPFARNLTRQSMMRYYVQHDLLWQDRPFDEAWQWRENHLVCVDEVPVGFVSLSDDTRALYIRELHLVAAARGKGVGGQVLETVIARAWQRRLAYVRLMVFKSNPAQRLYLRKGFVVAGEEESFLLLECRTDPSARAGQGAGLRNGRGEG